MTTPSTSPLFTAPSHGGAVLSIYHRSILTGAPILDSDVSMGCNECPNALSTAEIIANPGVGLDWTDLGDSGVVCPDCRLKQDYDSSLDDSQEDFTEWDLTPSVVQTLFLPDVLELAIDEETIRTVAARYAKGGISFCDNCPLSVVVREITGASSVTVTNMVHVYGDNSGIPAAQYECGSDISSFVTEFDKAMGVNKAGDRCRAGGHPVDGLAIAQLAARAPFHLILTKKGKLDA